MCFCPTRPCWRTTWTWSRRWKTPARTSACRSGWRAIRPRTIRACAFRPDAGPRRAGSEPAADRDWDELEELNATLHEEAHANRLIAGKFAYDGSHLSTGGGSHIVLGAATVLESPVLRRPDLLRSMVTFWQRHPSLSYLFSGMYVGPTSQYPRVDEARVDALYELEVAFSQLPREPVRRGSSMASSATCWWM